MQYEEWTGERPDHEVCAGATAVYSHPRAADSRACEAMIRQLEQQGVEVCEQSLEHLGKAYILDRRTQRVRAVQPRGGGSWPGHSLHPVALTLTHRHSHPPFCQGVALLRTMREQGRTPTRETYAFVIRRCIVRRKVEEAQALLEEAEEVHKGTWSNELSEQLRQEEEHQMWSGIFASLAAGRVPQLPELDSSDASPRRT